MTPLQKFNSLPARRRDEILDKYRQWNVEHSDWWDSTYECFRSDMEAIGVRVDKMRFSGFWSQGDGACFDGGVEDWPLFLTSIGYSDAALIYAAENFDWRMECKHDHYLYCHHKSVAYDACINLPDGVGDHYFADRYLEWGPDDIRTATLMTVLGKYSSNDLAEEFGTIFENYMLDLYKMLYQEYEYLTSDEVVLESLEANERLEEAIESIAEPSYA